MITVKILIAVVLCLCSVACAPPPKVEILEEQPWDGKCLGRPGDDGQIVYWGGPPYIPNDWKKLGTRYVCRDNGPPNHWWFVAIPEHRFMP